MASRRRRCWRNLSDDGAGETFASNIRAAKEPDSSILGLLRPRLNPLNWMNDIWRAALAATDAAEHAVVGAAVLTAHVLTAAPESSLNGSVTRCVATVPRGWTSPS